MCQKKGNGDHCGNNKHRRHHVSFGMWARVLCFSPVVTHGPVSGQTAWALGLQGCGHTARPWWDADRQCDAVLRRGVSGTSAQSGLFTRWLLRSGWMCRRPVLQWAAKHQNPHQTPPQSSVFSFSPDPVPGKRECRVGQYVVDVTSFEQLALPVLRNVSMCFCLLSLPVLCIMEAPGEQNDICSFREDSCAVYDLNSLNS